MKIAALTFVLLLTLALGASHAAPPTELIIDRFLSINQAAPPPELVIDNFPADSSVKKTPLANGSVIIRRASDPANIVGGARETEFQAVPLPGSYARETTFEIPRTGMMFVESGVRSSFRVVNFYGEDKHGNASPLNLRLQSLGYDHFRIEFDSSDVEMDYLIEVFDGNGNYAFLNGTDSTADRGSAFNADFPFASFALGGPDPINWNDIDGILVLFQTGNAAGSQDFAVKRVVALAPGQ